VSKGLDGSKEGGGEGEAKCSQVKSSESEVPSDFSWEDWVHRTTPVSGSVDWLTQNPCLRGQDHRVREVEAAEQVDRGGCGDEVYPRRTLHGPALLWVKVW